MAIARPESPAVAQASAAFATATAPSSRSRMLLKKSVTEIASTCSVIADLQTANTDALRTREVQQNTRNFVAAWALRFACCVRASGPSSAESPQEEHRISPDRTCHRDELDDVEPTLAALVLGHERLRSSEPLGQGMLGQ